jgi:hypothetical protein
LAAATSSTCAAKAQMRLRVTTDSGRIAHARTRAGLLTAISTILETGRTAGDL